MFPVDDGRQWHVVAGTDPGDVVLLHGVTLYSANLTTKTSALPHNLSLAVLSCGWECKYIWYFANFKWFWGKKNDEYLRECRLFPFRIILYQESQDCLSHIDWQNKSFKKLSYFWETLLGLIYPSLRRSSWPPHVDWRHCLEISFYKVCAPGKGWEGRKEYKEWPDQTRAS